MTIQTDLISVTNLCYLCYYITLITLILGSLMMLCAHSDDFSHKDSFSFLFGDYNINTSSFHSLFHLQTLPYTFPCSLLNSWPFKINCFSMHKCICIYMYIFSNVTCSVCIMLLSVCTSSGLTDHLVLDNHLVCSSLGETISLPLSIPLRKFTFDEAWEDEDMFFFPIIIVLSLLARDIYMFPRLALNAPSSCPRGSTIDTTTPYQLMYLKARWTRVYRD